MDMISRAVVFAEDNGTENLWCHYDMLETSTRVVFDWP